MDSIHMYGGEINGNLTHSSIGEKVRLVHVNSRKRGRQSVQKHHTKVFQFLIATCYRTLNMLHERELAFHF